ncbi:MAG: phosphotransferase family protein [Pseudomonadota bacterium]
MTAKPDMAALVRWAKGRVPGLDAGATCKQLTGGQSNPTFRIDTGKGAYVLRRKPPGALLSSAHAVDREFRVQQALAETPVPVARMRAYCADESVIGAAFYIMDHVPGRLFDQPALPGHACATRTALIAAMVGGLAAIHSVDLEATGLSDYGPPVPWAARQVKRWRTQYSATETEPVADMDALSQWLVQHLPEHEQERCLVHGDYRLDNLLYAPDRPEIAAVLDWELSTTGAPQADLAGVIMQWAMPATEEGRGLAGCDRAALGLPTDAAFVEDYCVRRGLTALPDWEFYLALAFFRMAAILQGVKKRALDGNAADPDRALRLGAHVPAFARAGLAAAHQ